MRRRTLAALLLAAFITSAAAGSAAGLLAWRHDALGRVLEVWNRGAMK